MRKQWHGDLEERQWAWEVLGRNITGSGNSKHKDFEVGLMYLGHSEQGEEKEEMRYMAIGRP